jgi:hypothetical protein
MDFLTFSLNSNFNILNQFYTNKFHKWLIIGFMLLYCDSESKYNINDNMDIDMDMNMNMNMNIDTDIYHNNFKNFDINNILKQKPNSKYFDIWSNWSINNTPFDNNDCIIYWNFIKNNKERIFIKIIKLLTIENTPHK